MAKFLFGPLAQIEAKDATVANLGGKAKKCWELASNGFPIPTAFCVGSAVYDEHVAKLGLDKQIDEVLSADPGKEILKEHYAILEQVRFKLQDAPLAEDVVKTLKEFFESLPANSAVSVRSSGTAEDRALASFAGQYETFLNRRNLEEIVSGVKACWASLWMNHLLQYRAKLKEKKATPRMAVLVMQQIRSTQAGVAFTQHPVTGSKNEIVMEAVYGQGEGLVSGTLNPDRFTVDRLSDEIRSRDVTKKQWKFELADGSVGTSKVAVQAEKQNVPCLSDDQIKKVAEVSKNAALFFGFPQDLEWAFEGDSFFLLQARPITKVSAPQVKLQSQNSFLTARPAFLPPGPGNWEQDAVHWPRPLSTYLAEIYPENFKRGFRHGTAACGALVDYLVFETVNQFCYMQPMPIMDHAEAGRRMGVAAEWWETKKWRSMYAHFKTKELPVWRQTNLDMAAIDFAKLKDEEVEANLNKLFDHSVQAVEWHHLYTAPVLVPLGDFLATVCEWTGKQKNEILPVFEAVSTVSQGVLDFPHSDKLIEYLQNHPDVVKELKAVADQKDANAVLDKLSQDKQIGQYINEYRTINNAKLVGGYDIVCETIGEVPTILTSGLVSMLDAPTKSAEAKERVGKVLKELREACPEDKRATFDELLEEARFVYPWRDERGLCADLWAQGILRLALLEVGRRLVKSGILTRPELILEGSKAEILDLWKNRSKAAVLKRRVELEDIDSDDEDFEEKKAKGAALDKDPWHPLVLPRTLESRLYFRKHNAGEVPLSLGPPAPPPPDPAGLPPAMGRLMRALGMGILGIFERKENSDDPKVIKGIPASSGVVEGTARLVLTPDDFHKLKKGDIIVTYSTSAAFNVVLPVAAGVVADYGGVLSHAAIVSREYGIPAVVSCLEAVVRIDNGSRIRVDGNKGEVVLLD